MCKCSEKVANFVLIFKFSNKNPHVIPDKTDRREVNILQL